MKDFLNKMTEKVSEAKDSVLDSISLDKITEKLGSIGDAAKEKITNTTNELITVSYNRRDGL